MLDVVRELIDAVDSLKALAPGRAAELHALLDQERPAPVKAAPAAAKADVPA